jgi:flagellar basal body P-ring formation protein FlgA
MIRRLTAALALLFAFGTAAAAQVTAALDPQHPVLRAAAVVTGSVVRVGDLVAHAGIIANVPIFRSPDLGATGTVPADAVVEAVRAHALVGLDTDGVTEVTVTRASRSIAPSEIDSRITKALAERYRLGAPEDIALDFDRDLHTLHVEPSAKGELRVTRLDFDARTGRFDATLDLPSGAVGRGTLHFSGRARVTVAAIAVAGPVARGEILKASDVIVEHLDRTQIRGQVLRRPEQAVGLAARGELEPGRPLRATDLMKPDVIQRNESVMLVYRVPGIVLTVRGRATQAGAEGDVISVLNEQSKRTVQGVVAGPGQVVVAGATTRLAANIVPAQSANPDGL